MALAGAVAGVNEDGEMAALLHCGNYGEVESVAREIGEGADAAFAEHDVVIAFAHYIFGGHQEFIERGGHAAFEEHGLFGAASAFEQREILHVARADLDYVGVLIDQIKRFIVDGFGDDAEAVGVANLGKDFQAGFAESLKTVGRGARLVGASTKEANAGGFELRGDGEALLFRLDGTGTGNHGEMLAADEDVTGRSGDADDGVFGFDVAARRACKAW